MEATEAAAKAKAKPKAQAARPRVHRADPVIVAARERLSLMTTEIKKTMKAVRSRKKALDKKHKRVMAKASMLSPEELVRVAAMKQLTVASKAAAHEAAVEPPAPPTPPAMVHRLPKAPVPPGSREAPEA